MSVAAVAFRAEVTPTVAKRPFNGCEAISATRSGDAGGSS